MTKILAQKSNWSGDVELLIFTEGRKRRAVASLVFTEIDEGLICSPTVTIGQKEAQVLIDALWDCGLRPSEGTGSAGALAATERHLADMRKLVFDGRPA